jgi:glycosyltransferase involved in cell wall biosynthesis
VPRDKLLIITPYYEPVKGGITTFALKLKNEFAKREKQVIVITQRGQQKDDVISIEENNIRFILKSYLKIRKYKPEIIQCFSHWQILLPAIFYKISHPKTIVVHTYNTEILDKVGFIKKKVLSWFVSRCDVVTFVSKYLMEEMQKKVDIKTKKAVIYDGCSVNPVYSNADILEFKSKYNITNDNKLIISTIAVFAYKLKVEGLKRLIESFKNVIKIFPTARLIIVGDGQYKNDLISLVNDLNIQENIVFTGYMNNVFVPIEVSDIYVHITLQEAGVAITILEAWALEKPVIVSNVGGIPEVVTDDVDGIVIDPIPDEISRTIINLYKEPDKMIKFGKEGMKTLQNKYNWEKIATEFINIYDSV